MDLPCRERRRPLPLFPSGGTGFLDRVAQEVLKMQESSSYNVAMREYATQPSADRLKHLAAPVRPQESGGCAATSDFRRGLAGGPVQHPTSVRALNVIAGHIAYGFSR